MQKEEIPYERLRKEREDYAKFNRGGSKDYWAYTHCGGCYGQCGARVRVVDGEPVAIEHTERPGGKGGCVARVLLP